MDSRGFDPIVSQAVEGVLETMFFTAPLGITDVEEAGGMPLEARLSFHGQISGMLAVRISENSGRMLAAGFLGEDEQNLNATQIGQVVCELANMLCGWLVSKLEGEEHFDLDSPHLILPGCAQRCEAPADSQQTFVLESGTLTVSLFLSEPNDTREQN